MSDGRTVQDQREQLLGYVLGALDKEEREEIGRRLRRDAELRSELLSAIESVKPLRAAPRDLVPPRGLARRTCAMVAAYAESTAQLVAAAARRTARPLASRMSASAMAPSSICGWRWVDLVTLATIATAASLLLFPAIHMSRARARLANCQSNFQQQALALTQQASLAPRADQPLAERPSYPEPALIQPAATETGRGQLVVQGPADESRQLIPSGPADFSDAIDLVGNSPERREPPMNVFRSPSGALPLVPVNFGGR
jgi:anti-sigma-K factor RskA